MRAAKPLCQLLAFGLLACGCEDRPTATDLHRAAESGDIQHVRSLRARGGSIDVEDENGDTPLQRTIGARYPFTRQRLSAART